MCNVVTGIFQADVTLSKRLKDGLSFIVIGNNGDIMVCVGQESTQIKDLVLVSKSKKIINMTLSFACNKKSRILVAIYERKFRHCSFNEGSRVSIVFSAQRIKNQDFDRNNSMM